MIKIVCFSSITTLVLLMETKRNWSNRTVNDHTVRVFVSIGCRGSAWPIWISTSASPDDVKKPFVHVHSIWIYFLFAAHLYIVSAESCVVCEISRNISTERARARTSIAFWGRARKFIAKFIQSVLWRWFRLWRAFLCVAAALFHIVMVKIFLLVFVVAAVAGMELIIICNLLLTQNSFEFWLLPP